MARPRRRDRHERGLRGPLAPATSPATVPRSERFGDLVVAAVDRLEPRWGTRLAAVDVEIHDVPDVTDPDGSEVPLAGHRPASGSRAATIVVYRRPVELRAPEHLDRVDLVRDLVAEQLAELLGMAPSDLDPSYDERGGD
ncbi:MAG TPA: metallopeptidase family protein [Candidatus Angelobacter sp.]|nr:metallopeptidase family protein [Candidatus Angelobacter sp.]